MSLRQQMIIEELVEAADDAFKELQNISTTKGGNLKYQVWFQRMTTPYFPRTFVKLQRALMRGQAYLRDPDQEPHIDIPF
jgi:hypothetical protein